MIHTLTLNPAIDKIIYLDRFEKNRTNRIKGSKVVLGGKGTHVSINLKLIGKDSTAFGVCFGPTGTRVLEMLEQEGIQTQFIHENAGDTRTNYLLIEDSHDCSIIAEKGPMLTDNLLEQLIGRMREIISSKDILVLSGDASNSPNPQIYNELLAALREKSLKVFLDTSGESLKQCAQTAPYLIKPNLDELSFLCGIPMRELETDGQIIAAMESIAHYGIHVIAVSLGGDGSIVKWGDEVYRVTPPEVEVFNTIGCGDCFLSGLIAGFSDNLPVADTLRLATAISSATAESSDSVGFDIKRANGLMDSVEIKKLK